MEFASSLAQLVFALLFVVPGVTYAAVSRTLRGPSPEDLETGSRFMRALGASIVFDAVYLWLLGRPLLTMSTPHAGQSRLSHFAEVAPAVGFTALVLLVIIPAMCSLLVHLTAPARERWVRAVYNPIPTSWDFALRRQQRVFVRALLPGERWVGGWLGSDSYASRFPQSRDLFIQEAWQLGSDGSFVVPQPESSGVWINCAEAAFVEFGGPLPGPDRPTSGTEYRQGRREGLRGGRRVDDTKVSADNGENP